MDPVVRHLDLFSGIGGFALACRMVGGIETVAFCEREPYCQRVLAKHWPTVPICNDIHDLKGTEYGTIDIITGGYPCQPFSLSGERRGKEDDRHLWPELRRIVETARPRWCLFENVVGHVTLGLDEVLSDLDSIRYASGATVLPACAVDAWHRRDRVWIVANDQGKSLQKSEVVEAQTLLSEFGGASDAEGVRASVWEADQPSMVGVVHGVSSWMERATAIGNAIVPQVAAEIIRAMMQADRQANAERLRSPASGDKQDALVGNSGGGQ